MSKYMDYQEDQLKARTKAFAVRNFKLCRSLESDEQGRMVGRQLMRSASSVAANYRAACRPRSHAEFVSKIGVVVEEIDETVFWLELLVDIGLVKQELLAELLREANELLAIFAASQHTARKRAQSAN